jgi:hypothetical protein
VKLRISTSAASSIRVTAGAAGERQPGGVYAETCRFTSLVALTLVLWRIAVSRMTKRLID